MVHRPPANKKAFNLLLRSALSMFLCLGYKSSARHGRHVWFLYSLRQGSYTRPAETCAIRISQDFFFFSLSDNREALRQLRHVGMYAQQTLCDPHETSGQPIVFYSLFTESLAKPAAIASPRVIFSGALSITNVRVVNFNTVHGTDGP